MKINFYILTYIFIIVIISPKTLQSKNLGDLTKQKPIEMNIQLNGKIGKMHFFHQMYLPLRLENFTN